MKYLIISILAIFTLSACNSTEKPNQDAPPTANPEPIPPIIGFSIVKTHPKDSTYFTEGLEFHDGKLLESSGGNNEESPYPSAFGFVNFKTGKNDTKIVLDKSQYFGEGITVFNNTIYQLTWKGKKGFIYDYPSFKKKGEFIIPSPEGWGLTHDTSNLIMSDGSNSIYFLNPSTLQVTNIIGILDNSGPVGNINELEYVDGFLYANRWLTPYILKLT
ncbi:MAG: glutaminyl-peptide cyclotransferase [Chitinophagaceae bacterium]|nr:glutaminyl-peptide cyclotransferase [Chitinophagaceae bacterium]